MIDEIEFPVDSTCKAVGWCLYRLLVTGTIAEQLDRLDTVVVYTTCRLNGCLS